VVNGKADITGQDRGELESLIRREANPTAPEVAIAGGQVTIGKGTAGRYDVWLVRFDPSIENVPIARGENRGITLPHKNVVKQLVKLGAWNGDPASFALPPTPQTGLKEAVFVQAGSGGAIVAAVR
jgi:hypothetical protein